MARQQRTQIGIIGAGPAGLLLARLLKLNGIDSVILEARSRAYVEARIRAGVLEHGTVKLLEEAGVAERLHREGLVHEGVELGLDGGRFRIDLAGLAGKTITVYGQSEVVQDLIAARLAGDGPIVWEASDVALHDIETDRPRLTYRADGVEQELACDFIAGCDGFRGVSRSSVPASSLRSYEQDYPFSWLGILADVPPCSEELIYASPDVTPHVTTGPALEKSITGLHSFVCLPMRHGRLFLAGDAAHIVPPTGAKGLNLAASDIYYLSRALVSHYARNDGALLGSYSDQASARVWKAERFSWWLTLLMHKVHPEGSFAEQMQRAEIDYLLSSPAGQTVFAENYVGLPF